VHYQKLISGTVLALTLVTGGAQADQTTTKAVLDHHLASFGAGDVKGILADYTKNSVIVLPSGVLHGKAEIKGLFDGFVKEFGKKNVVFKLTGSTVTDDVAYITWSAETPDNSYSFASDTFVIKNGKIAYQTVALVVTAKK